MIAHPKGTTAASPRSVLGAVALGVLLGWAGARPLAGLGPWNVALWAGAVVALGVVEGSPRAKAARLGTFGFAVGFAFMCFGYAGEASLVTRVPPFALIGLFCGLCAIAFGGVVHVIQGAVGRRS